MKLKTPLLLIITLALTNNIANAKTKTIKPNQQKTKVKEDYIQFHPPQTKAEKALDVIVNCNDQRGFKKLTTDAFRQDDTYKRTREFLFQYLFYGYLDDGPIKTKNEYLFYYYTHKQNNGIAYISMEPHFGNKEDYNKPGVMSVSRLYITNRQSIEYSKEDFVVAKYNKKAKIWQLDGICLNGIVEINCPISTRST